MAASYRNPFQFIITLIILSSTLYSPVTEKKRRKIKHQPTNHIYSAIRFATINMCEINEQLASEACRQQT
jgi:hypothetical protein